MVENRGVYGENYDALISSVSLVSERAGLSGKFDPQQPPCHSYNRFGRKYGPVDGKSDFILTLDKGVPTYYFHPELPFWASGSPSLADGE